MGNALCCIFYFIFPSQSNLLFCWLVYYPIKIHTVQLQKKSCCTICSHGYQEMDSRKWANFRRSTNEMGMNYIILEASKYPFMLCSIGRVFLLSLNQI